MRLALERFKLASDAEAQWREESLDDHKFRVGEQWVSEIKTARKARNLPCLTINRVPRQIALVTNEQRQQRPAGQVNPVGDGADKETADVIQGAIRHIEVQSDADIAKDMSFDDMVTGGIGWLRLVNKFISDDSDEQELYVEPVENWASVYSDPYETYFRTAKYRFITHDYGPEEYKREFGKSALAAIPIEQWSSIGDQAPGWIRGDGVRVAEYFFIEEEKSKNDRKPKTTVYWAKINGIEEVEPRTTWLVDDEIPVFPVKGEEKIVDGKKHLAGLVRYSKDPARMYNVWISAATTMIGMAPKPKYIAAAGQVEDFLDDWQNANDPERVLLRYLPMDIKGNQVPAPDLQSFEPPIQALAVMVKQADNDFKATTGIYDASLGEKGPDESGKALKARQQQTDIAILNFSDNLSRTLVKVYRHIVKWIQKGYSEKKLLRIINPDGSVEMVSVNGAKLEAGVKKVFDLRVGSYDVIVKVGPSYDTKRQESVATQLELAKAMPIVGQAAPDMLIRNMDIPQADEIADRVKMMLPPQVLQAEQDKEQQITPQVRAQMAHMGQQIDLLIKTSQEYLDIIKTKKVETDSKERVETAKLDLERYRIDMDSYTKQAVANISTKAQDGRVRAEIDANIISDKHQAAHEVGMSVMEHKQGMQAADQQHAQNMAAGAQDAQNQSALSGQGHQQALEQGEQSGQQQSDLQAQAAQNQDNGAGQ